MKIDIKNSNIMTVWKLSNQIEEFDNPYGIEEYKSRLTNVRHKILVAYFGDIPVGFKVGYAKSNKVFYTWLGGVLKTYRTKGIAKSLANVQEAWVRSEGFNLIELKTRNIHKRMLIFALSNGFYITNVEPQLDPKQNRIYLEKRLIP